MLALRMPCPIEMILRDIKMNRLFTRTALLALVLTTLTFAQMGGGMGNGNGGGMMGPGNAGTLGRRG